MSDELTIWTKLGLGALSLVTGGIGAQEWRFRRHEKRHDDLDKRVDALSENIPQTYRAQSDCDKICGRIERTVEKIEVKMDVNQKETREDLRRIFDKLDGKEDKH